MRKDAGKPYSIVKLHDRDERCWGVTDAKGGLVDVDGMSMRLTRSEARTLAENRNSDSESSDRTPCAQRP